MAMGKSIKEPLEIMRQPFPELEIALAGNAITPRGGNFNNLTALRTAFHHQFNAQFKAAR